MHKENWFDRFSAAVAENTGRAWFFTASVALILLWLPSFVFFDSPDTWQLVINTVTTILTFLMVALLQNTTERFENAVNARLQEIIDKLEGASDPVTDDKAKPKKS